MKLRWILILAMLVIFPITALSESTKPEPYVCEGKYKDGSKPKPEELKKILSDHLAWTGSGYKENDPRQANLCKADLREAYLSGADLSGANLFRAYLSGADLSGANLSGADLSEAILSKADLSGANLFRAYLSGAYLSGANLSGADLNEAILSKAYLFRADLSGADLIEADLSKAILNQANLFRAYLSRADLSGADLSGAKLVEVDLSGADLSGAKILGDINNTKLTGVNLTRATYQSNSSPDKGFLSSIQNLETVIFKEGEQTGLVLLKKGLKEAGLRDLERDANFAIEKVKTGHLTPSIEKYARLIFFEWTAGYGLYPERSLIILLCLIPVFAIFYLLSIFKEREYRDNNSLVGQGSGIYRIWNAERIRKNLGSNEPELVSGNLIKSAGYALYFSILSAFHVGWKDVNVGNWIARIQPREYTLRSTGWVRAVSGIQSLISIYLLAFWVLTQFGRPFD